MIEIQKTIFDKTCPDKNWLVQRTEAILVHLATLKAHKFKIFTTKDINIVIRLVNKTESQVLNLQYRRRNRPTNILAFINNSDDLPAVLQNEMANYLGDLVICFPVVKSEAKQQQKNIKDHLTHLIIHGILHLLGYRHYKECDMKIMEDLEDKILAEFAIYLLR